VPTYHRLHSPTQTARVARAQVASGEIWGSIPVGGMYPKVGAYRGPLAEGAEGIEFTTDIPVDAGGTPSRVTWTPARPGVWLEDGYAKIAVTITKNTADNGVTNEHTNA